MSSRHVELAEQILAFVVEHGVLDGLESHERQERVQQLCDLIARAYWLGTDDGRTQVMDVFREMAPELGRQNLQFGVQLALSQIANPQ